MNVAAGWEKFRSLLRRPVSAEVPAPRASTPPPTPASNESPVDPRPAIAAVEAKLQSLSSRLESAERATPAAPIAGDLDSIRKALEAVRSESARQAAELAQLRSLASDVERRGSEDASRVATIAENQNAIDVRFAEMDERSRDLQESLSAAEEMLRATRQELLERETRRNREIAGRLAGLYIVAFVALLAALATLVLYLAGTD